MRRAIELHLRGDFAAAEQRLRAVLALDPRLPQAHHHLAVVLHSCGRIVEAVRHLTIALDLDPFLVGARERMEGYREELADRRVRPIGSAGDDAPIEEAG